MARIFLCHSNEDKPEVEELYDHLRALGFEPWMEKKDLIPGQNWPRDIPQVLRASALVLVCLSQTTARLSNVQHEFKLVVDTLQTMPQGMSRTIPVRLEPCPIPKPLRALHGCNLFEAHGYDKLEQVIRYRFEKRGLTLPEASSFRPRFETSSALDGFSGEESVMPPDELQTSAARFTNSIDMTFVRLPAGTFWMGSPDSDSRAYANERPQHLVRISEPFYLGIHPVTQAQWEAVMGNNPSRFQGDSAHPVEQVLWDDVQQFLDRLSEQDSRPYRLPSEAQWEYACRAGASGLYCFGDEMSELGNYAWYDINADGTTHPVGQKQPNDWGLYDMHGNVWEWVQDWYGTYSADAVTDPRGPRTGADRVVRGGGRALSARDARSANRAWLPPGLRNSYVGFRCLSSAPRP